MNHQMIEEEVQNANGENSIKMKLERNLCGMTSSISQESLTLHMFDISTTLESATDREFHLPYYRYDSFYDLSYFSFHDTY